MSRREKSIKLLKKCSILLSCILVFLFCTLNVLAKGDTTTDDSKIKVNDNNLITGEETEFEISTSTPYGMNFTTPPFKGNSAYSRILVNGNDNRHKIKHPEVWPFSATCFAVFIWPDGSREFGTAFMVGPRTAVTSGHCGYQTKRGGKVISMRLFPGKNGLSNPYGMANVTNVYTEGTWNLEGQTKNDYAILRLDTNIGDYSGWYGLESTPGKEYYKGTVVHVPGFPGEFVTNNALSANMYNKEGKITACITKVLTYNMDTTSGQSGAPIYRDDNQYVIGIHSRPSSTYSNRNEGFRLTSYMVNWVRSFL